MYLNFPSHGEDDDLVRSALGGEAYAHLAKAKRAYDPENLLRMNQNVRPEQRATEACRTAAGALLTRLRISTKTVVFRRL